MPAPGARARRTAIARLLFSAATIVTPLAACSGGRDSIEKSTDVRGAPSASSSGTSAHAQGSYDYIARRGLGTVALAEARGLPEDATHTSVDAIADHLQSCASDLQKDGKLAKGATRIIAEVNDDGTVGRLNVTVSGGSEVMANAILCVIAPLRAQVFPPVNGAKTPRGLALEAMWE